MNFGYSPSSLSKQVSNEAILYNGLNGLRGWRLAKARLDAGVDEIVNVNFLGSSLTEGYNSAADDSLGFVDVVRTALTAKYGDVGQGWIGNRYPVILSAANRRWVYTGAWNTFWGVGWLYLNNGQAVLGYSTSGTATITLPGTEINLFATCGSGQVATVTVTIDGGTAETWTIPTGTKLNYTVFTKTGLTDGDHTVVVTATTNASNRFELLGGYGTKGTRGIRVNKMGAAGGTSTAFGTYNALWDGGYPNTDICVKHWTPALTVLDAIANDYNTQLPLDTFRSNWQNMITQAKLHSASVVATSIGGIFNVTKTIPIEQYQQIVFDLAMANDIAYLDITKSLGGTHANASDFMSDEVHYNTYGHMHTGNCFLRSWEVA